MRFVRNTTSVALAFFALFLLTYPTLRPYTIITFGTSLTASGQWQSKLADEVSSRIGRFVWIINFGVDGGTSNQNVRRIQQASLFATFPSVVLIEYAVNDTWRMSLEQSRANTLNNIRIIQKRAPKARIFLVATNPVYNDKDRPNLQAYFDQYPSIAEEAGVGFINLTPIWSAVLKPELIPDGVHPTTEAYSSVIPAMADAIASSSRR